MMLFMMVLLAVVSAWAITMLIMYCLELDNGSATKEEVTELREMNDTIKRLYKEVVVLPRQLNGTSIIKLDEKNNSVAVVKASTKNTLRSDGSGGKIDHGWTRLIIQTYYSTSVPVGIAKCTEKLLKNNPGYRYRFFDDIESRQFIRDNFDSDVLEAYDILLPGAFKSDVFRLCALYVLGGVYIDMSTVSLASIDSVIAALPNGGAGVEVISTVDRPNPRFMVHQAFIACKSPKNPAIKYILDGIVDNCLNRRMGDCMLDVTGPSAFGKLLNEYNGEEKEAPRKPHSVIDGWYFCNHITGNVFSTKSTKLFATKYKGWRKDRRPGRHYSTMYKSNQVFREKEQDVK